MYCEHIITLGGIKLLPHTKGYWSSNHLYTKTNERQADPEDTPNLFMY